MQTSRVPMGVIKLMHGGAMYRQQESQRQMQIEVIRISCQRSMR
jgi:hypothetical protein